MYYNSGSKIVRNRLYRHPPSCTIRQLAVLAATRLYWLLLDSISAHLTFLVDCIDSHSTVLATIRFYWQAPGCTGRQSAVLTATRLYWQPLDYIGKHLDVLVDSRLY